MSISNVTVPTLSIWRPQPGKATGTAVIVAPGGAFTGLAWNLEGASVAKWLASQGVTAFVLKYRVHQPLPGEESKAMPPVRYEQSQHVKTGEKLAMEDGMQAVKLVRSNAARFGIDPHRIGFLGFSAGAMTAMNVVMKGDSESRPDFVAPIYGAAPAVPVPQDAPPLFEVVAVDDPIMFPRALVIFDQWTAAGKQAELHVYEKGGHGFGLGNKDMPVGKWPEAFAAWMVDHGFLPAPK
ncbi:alpha/beta hydrolase [Novosphingobium album (ex Hu et al. 2023)]|uniref:Alpha/beta hydrolase n=1 Tax=Novosphingobium album (ex Hu et al. 2023) TaxID=2930093 RepID=A0ABT0B5D5_9SPHN|nr:alpha/beta hydrolase [Novosphingobium album (ex Hu et al. 2023)]MCJ2180236.1 alpha/beta hydrolase [Novosphingobium album (ex Hu et al. 2023)]